ncbi:MAG: sulfite exporter TauE/SafE family protein [Chloroflexi bacterium]|nr:sulfite exporter TauE/SafE family protein [Chloroflexota bacterium]
MFLVLFLIAIIVGALGALLGIGGGVLIIPLLTVFFHIPIKVAIGASLVSVIATSTAAGAVYAGRSLTHTKLGMVLEITTTLGALTGGLTAALLSPRVLHGLFAVLLLFVMYSMRQIPRDEAISRPTGLFDTVYKDPFTGKLVRYGVRNLPLGLGAAFIAGNLSGLLGIGGGVVKVPIMSVVMGAPLKAAIATSNFMVGVTAATSAMVYYVQDLIDPQVAVPTALGVLIGAQLGSRLGGRARSLTLKRMFQVLLVIFAIQMAWKAITG